MEHDFSARGERIKGKKVRLPISCPAYFDLFRLASFVFDFLMILVLFFLIRNVRMVKQETATIPRPKIMGGTGERDKGIWDKK